jgi:endoglycosylceramidase
MRFLSTVLGFLLFAGVLSGCSAERSRPVDLPTTTASSLPTPPSSAAVGAALWTANGTMVDSSGQAVELHGVNEGRLDLGSGSSTPDACHQGWSEPTPAEASVIASTGFNVVRLAVSWENAEPTPPTASLTGLTHHWNGAYLDALDRAVSTFTRVGLHVVLDLHQSYLSPAFKGETKGSRTVCEGEGLPTWMFPDASSEDHDVARCKVLENIAEPEVPQSPYNGLAAVWTMLTTRYRSNDLVAGADLFNEPDPAASCPAIGRQVVELYDRLGHTVRELAPHWVLFLEDSSNSSAGFPPILTALPSLPGVVYEFHFYPDSAADGVRLFTQFVDRAKRWQVPAYMGEFDGFGEDSNYTGPTDPNWAADLSSILSRCDTQHVGWSLWEYAGSESLVEPGTNTPKPALLRVLQQYP